MRKETVLNDVVKYKLVLIDAGKNKKEVARLLGNISKIPFYEFSNFVENTPVVFKEVVCSAVEAKRIKDKFEKVGAKVSMVKF